MSAGNDEIVTALYDYTANDPEELSIRKNEQLVLLDAKFTWWKVRNGNGKLGLVPSNFLRRDKVKGESFVNRIAQKLPGAKKGKVGGGVNVGGGRNTGALYPSSGSAMANSNQINEEYVSKFNYDATRDDELTLTKGMRVLVLEMEGDGWWYGKNADRPGNPGWFPSNYVTKESNNSSSINTQSYNEPSKQQNGDYIMVVRTLYPFNSGNAEELAFEQDEMLDIIEQPTDDPEWWMARNSECTTGLVPKNYVEAVPGAKSVVQPSYDPVCPNPISQPSNNSSSLRSEPSRGFNQVSEKPWFFGPIRRAEAEQYLRDRAKNGEFLVRNCETAQGEYSISMKMPGRIRHFKVTVLSDGQYGIGQRKFDSLDTLLDHYKRAPIFTSAEQGKVYLTNPVQR